jgi:FixJ family two-component response regulator
LPNVPLVAVVDDDESVRASVGSLVRSIGRTALTFASAEAFLGSAEAEATGCLIADIQMPGMNGLELQETLVTQGRRLPIIFITAWPEDRIRQQVLASGALCMLSKPCDSDALVNYIETALSPPASNAV